MHGISLCFFYLKIRLNKNDKTILKINQHQKTFINSIIKIMRFILPKEFIVSLSVSLLIGWWFVFVFVIHIQNTPTWYFRKLYVKLYALCSTKNRQINYFQMQCAINAHIFSTFHELNKRNLLHSKYHVFVF